MFATLKQIFAPTNSDLRKRILFTLGALLIFIIGTGVPVPGTTNITKNLGFLELINAMGGGSLKNFSIFALGVSPYITASIIIQLLEMDIVPYFSELSKEGPVGRRKLNQITRYVGIVFAFIEGYAFSFAFLGASSAFEYLYVATILTAGTAFCLWLGDQITQKGIGNGVSLLIMAGIISTIPNMFSSTFKALVLDNTSSMAIGIASFALFIIAYILIIVGIVFIECSERRVPIQYANQSSSAYGAKQNYIPFKLNSASVMPVIFASVIFSIPTFIAGLMDKNSAFVEFVTKYVNYTTPVGFCAYVIIIMLFSFFYTFLTVNPEELSKNLNRQGGYIPGVRPGKETKDYISTVLGRITLVGALFIVLIAGLPIVFGSFIPTSLPSNVSIGGTSILIVVGVALETWKQLESSLVNRSYSKGGRY